MRDLAQQPTPADRDDRSLLAAWIDERDEVSLQELLRRHRPMARGVCARILRDPAEAEDAVQDVCIAVSRLESGVEGEFAAWLRASAAKSALQYRRARIRRRRRELAGSAPAAPGRNGGDLLHLVEECVELLPEADRELVERYFYLDQSQGEIATAAGISQVAVHKRLRATLGRMQALLRRRGVRIGAIALLLALCGDEVRARSAATELGLGSGWLATAAVAAVLALGCIGLLQLGWRPAAAPPLAAVEPAATASSRMVLAGPGFADADWRVYAVVPDQQSMANALVGMSPTDTSIQQVDVEVDPHLRWVEDVFDGRSATVLDVEASEKREFWLISRQRIPPGMPMGVRLRYWHRDDQGHWLLGDYHFCLVLRDGEPATYFSVRFVDLQGRLVQASDQPPVVGLPELLSNHGLIIRVTSHQRLHAPELRLLGWEEIVALVRFADPANVDRGIEPVLAVDGETTPVPRRPSAGF